MSDRIAATREPGISITDISVVARFAFDALHTPDPSGTVASWKVADSEGVMRSTWRAGIAFKQTARWRSSCEQVTGSEGIVGAGIRALCPPWRFRCRSFLFEIAKLKAAPRFYRQLYSALEFTFSPRFVSCREYWFRWQLSRRASDGAD